MNWRDEVAIHPEVARPPEATEVQWHTPQPLPDGLLPVEAFRKAQNKCRAVAKQIDLACSQPGGRLLRPFFEFSGRIFQKHTSDGAGRDFSGSRRRSVDGQQRQLPRSITCRSPKPTSTSRCSTVPIHPVCPREWYRSLTGDLLVLRSREDSLWSRWSVAQRAVLPNGVAVNSISPFADRFLDL